MSLPLFPQGSLHQAFADLRRDLIHEDGPRISTMRNYRFAIVQYEPQLEFKLRSEVQKLSADLIANGWRVLSSPCKSSCSSASTHKEPTTSNG